MKKIIAIVMMTLLLITGCNSASPNGVKIDEEFQISYLESDITEDDIYEMADLIVTGKIGKDVDVITNEILNEETGEVLATSDLNVYEFEIKDSIVNPDEFKKIRIITTTAKQFLREQEVTVEKNEKYLFYLTYIPELNAYGIISYEKGVYKINGENAKSLDKEVNLYELIEDLSKK